MITYAHRCPCAQTHTYTETQEEKRRLMLTHIKISFFISFIDSVILRFGLSDRELCLHVCIIYSSSSADKPCQGGQEDLSLRLKFEHEENLNSRGNDVRDMEISNSCMRQKTELSATSFCENTIR